MDAKAFAKQAHEGQTYGDRPYWKHLEEVVSILSVHDADDQLLQMGWLHDVVEDTDVTVRDVEETFGFEVALGVWALTDVRVDNRWDRKAQSYPKNGRYVESATVKLADRLANVRASQNDAHSVDLTDMYIREQPQVIKHLRRGHLEIFEKVNDALGYAVDAPMIYAEGMAQVEALLLHMEELRYKSGEDYLRVWVDDHQPFVRKDIDLSEGGWFHASF